MCLKRQKPCTPICRPKKCNKPPKPAGEGRGEAQNHNKPPKPAGGGREKAYAGVCCSLLGLKDEQRRVSTQWLQGRGGQKPITRLIWVCLDGDGMGWVNAGTPMGSPGAGHGSARAPLLPLFPGLIPPYPALRIQEIKIDGEQIALARSSLLKRVVAGKQLPDVRKLSGRRTDRP